MSTIPCAMIDIGVNFTDPVFQGIYRGKQKHVNDFSVVLDRARAVGVQKIMITGGNLEESKAALSLTREYPSFELFSTVGVHPTRCNDFEKDGTDPDKYFQELLNVCQDGISDGKVVAVGEFGLDYDRLEFCSKDVQQKYFEKQFQLAELTGLPLFLHNRNTRGDFNGTVICRRPVGIEWREVGVNQWSRVEMIKKNRHRFSHGVVHSFTGSKEEALELVELGLFIGINGCSLKTEENLHVVKSIPVEWMMIETDAPWCDIRSTHAGFQHVKTKWQSKKAEKYENGKLVKGRNEPCAIIQVAEVICAVKELPMEEFTRCMYNNTSKVFFANKKHT